MNFIRAKPLKNDYFLTLHGTAVTNPHSFYCKALQGSVEPFTGYSDTLIFPILLSGFRAGHPIRVHLLPLKTIFSLKLRDV